jgi:hypothetical protein
MGSAFVVGVGYEDDAGAEASPRRTTQSQLAKVYQRDWRSVIIDDAGDPGRRLRYHLHVNHRQNLSNLKRVQGVSVVTHSEQQEQHRIFPRTGTIPA